MQLSVKGSAKNIIRDLRVVNKQVQVAATTSALNKTNDRIFTRSKRQIATAVGIQQKHIAKAGNKGLMRKYKATWRKQQARTWFGLKNKLPVIKVVRNVKGIGKFSHYTKSTMHGKTAADAFVAKMPTGHEGIFVRKPESMDWRGGKDGPRDRKNRLKRWRLPIREVKIDFSSIAETTLDRVGNAIGEKTFKEQFTREMKRRLNSKNSKGYRRFG